MAKTALGRTIRLKRMKVMKDPENCNYPLHTCAAAKCSNPADVIDATYNRWSVEVPLCDFHYIKVLQNEC